jgi:hypothetical protein
MSPKEFCSQRDRRAVRISACFEDLARLAASFRGRWRWVQMNGRWPECFLQVG